MARAAGEDKGEQHAAGSMPELPEVEASRRQIEAQCAGLTITAVHANEAGGHARSGEFDAIVFDDPDASASMVAAALMGKTLVGVRRRGKQLWLELSSPPHLLGHFGMTGAFAIKGVEPLSYKQFKVHTEEWPPRFTKLELSFGDGTAALAFCDPRRLGRLRLRHDPEAEAPWKSLAPDGLLELPPVTAMCARLSSTTAVIKALLLDQNKLLSGVGNWVADEVLFHSGIHPESACDTLSDAQVNRLHAALRDVLSTAVGCNAESQAFPSSWLFHYRWGKGANGTTVPGVHGGAISFSTVGGRTSAVVLSRQKKGERAASGGSKAPSAKATGSKSKRSVVVDEAATDDAAAADPKTAMNKLPRSKSPSSQEAKKADEGDSSRGTGSGRPKAKRA